MTGKKKINLKILTDKKQFMSKEEIEARERGKPIYEFREEKDRIDGWEKESDEVLEKYLLKAKAIDARENDLEGVEKQREAIEKEIGELENRLKQLNGELTKLNVILAKANRPEGWIYGDDILSFITENPKWSVEEDPYFLEGVIFSKVMDGHVAQLIIRVLQRETGSFVIGLEIEDSLNYKYAHDDTYDEIHKDIPKLLFGSIRDNWDGYDDFCEDHDHYFQKEYADLESAKKGILKALLLVEKKIGDHHAFNLPM